MRTAQPARPARLAAMVMALVTMATLTACMPRSSAGDAAVSQVGVPYLWGGTTPESGFDCSGLMAWAWSKADVTLPRTSSGQYAATRRIPRSELRPGDLVFWGTGDQVSHVAMYVGNGRVVQARKIGTLVEYQSVDWWASNRIGYGRVQS